MCFPPLVKANEYFEWIDESHLQALHEGRQAWSAVHLLLRGEASVADGSEGVGGSLGEASGSGVHSLLMDAPPTCSRSCPRDPRCPKPAGHRGHCKLKGNEGDPVLVPAAAPACTTTKEPIATELHESNKEVEVEVVVEKDEEEEEVVEVDEMEEEEEEVEVVEVDEMEEEGVEERVEEAPSRTEELGPSIPAAASYVKELSDAPEERTAEEESGSQIVVEQEIAVDPKVSSFIADAADAVDAAAAVDEEAGSSENQETQGGVAVGVSDAVEECEGRSWRKRKPVDYVSARVSSEISNEMERPQSLNKACVLHDTKPTSPAGPEAVSEQARPSSPLAPISSGRLRIAPQRLDASVLVAPLHEKPGLAREASRRTESALDDGGSDSDGNGAGNGLWDNTVAKDAAAPVKDAATPVEDVAAPAEGAAAPAEGAAVPAEDATTPVEDVAAPAEGAATPVEDVAAPAEGAAAPAEGAAVPAEDATTPVEDAATPVEDVAAPAEGAAVPAEGAAVPAEDAAVPVEDAASPAEGAAAAVDGAARRTILQRPDCGEGRSRRKRKPVDYVSARVSSEISNEMERPQSLKKACVLHDTKPTSPAGPEAASALVAAPEVDDSTGYWAGVEVVADELAQDHPSSSELLGSEVCVLAAAYPTDALSRRRAIGWRGLVTHRRGGASDPQVRVFGFWFRLADETFLKPVKQLTQGKGGE